MKKALFFVFLLVVTSFCTENLLAQQNTSFLGQLTYDDAETCSDIWGYAAEGREYAIVGVTNGVSVVEVTQPSFPVEVGFVPGPYAFWRDMKTWGTHAFCVDDQAGQGLIVIDMSELPGGGEISYEFWNGNDEVNFATCHNIFIDENGIAYLFGCDYGVGGAIMVDVTNPNELEVVGVYDVNYIHDGYVKDDLMFAGEIYVGTLTAVDVSDKSMPIVLGSVATPSNFTHNCWLSQDGNYVYTTDEVNSGYIGAYNVSDITDMYEVNKIQSSPGSGVIPHNTFVINNFLVTSYYRDGVVIHDATHPDNIIQVGDYDTDTELEGSGFDGCWGVYPYLPSGNIIASDINNGLFVLDVDYVQAAYLRGNVTDLDTGLPISNVTVTILESDATSSTTDFMGNYAGGVVQFGNYDIQFSKPGYETVIVEGILYNTLEATVNAQMQANPNFTLQGQVLDMNWQAVENATVSFINSEFEYVATTNEGGYFNVPTFFAGNYDMFAGKWGYVSTALANENIPFDTPFITLQLNNGYYDDFALDFGWTTEGTTPTGGEWEWVVPQNFNDFGFPLNAPNDLDNDFGNKAYVTGNSEVTDFVNAGTVSLTSPIFDLTAYGLPRIDFSLWFVNEGYFGGGTNDKITVSLSNGSENTVVLEWTSADGTLADWTGFSVYPLDFMELTNNMQLIVDVEADFNQSEATEAGFDGFQIVDETGIVGINNNQSSNQPNIQLYPNPAIDQLKVEGLAQNENHNFTLYNLSGQAVLTRIIVGNSDVISLNRLTPGMYTYQVLDSKRLNVIAGKLFINR